MRDIKFRFWDKHVGKFTDFGAIHIDGDIMTRSATFGGLYDFVTDEMEENIIIQQYTGLKDRSGTEIFEGDIVTCMKETWRDKKTYTADVRWQDNVSRFAFVIRYDGDDGELFYDCLSVEDIKVIGNIYENSDLLK